MKYRLSVVRRVLFTSTAVLLLVGVVAPLLQTGHAAAAQLTTRSITVSDSGPSGGTITTGVGSGTGVTYKVAFTTASTANSLVIDFCAESPIINATCTAPTGMSAASATLGSGTGNMGGWTITPSASQIKMSVGSGTAAAAGSQIFTLSGITNPSALGTFFARIYTYSAANEPTYTSATNVGTYADYGGIALTTAQVISITARVAESLTFCVSGTVQSSWTTHDCTATQAASSPALTLGHGSPTPTLDSTAVDTGTVYSQLSTNAIHGVVIDLRNSNTTCGGLSSDGGATCGIPAVGSTASAITAGTAAFGLFVAPSTDDTNGLGSLAINTNYDDGTHTTAPNLYYGMNATNVDSTYGDTLATATGPVYRVDSAYTFGATASLTTPAGVYKANMDLIATGTF
jgi:hypothetical protein